ncbi:paraneoplastic antigen Ma2-like, partial [Anneissia japonica]|uniref:paraneoplastic antigen Ma2-like n=1 Tax=Anneissia japonica TaxID=1529436 RepID=UPI001425971B
EFDEAEVVEKLDETETTFQLLITFSKPVADLDLPLVIKRSDLETWSLVKWEGKDPKPIDDFETQLSKFLQGHGKTLNVIKLDSIPKDTKEVVIKHLVDNTPTRQAGVRRLRQFSGRVPIPTNEIDFETWSQLVQQLIRDSSLSEADKKSILIQSLFPPALNILNKVAAESRATECHDVLNQVYGLVVDADDLYTLFRETYQTKGELPSKFLMRLDENLTRANNVGAVGVAQADNLRLAQFIRGLIHDELLCSTLNLKHRKPNPPSYLTLIKEVRNEEINSRARAEKRNTQTTTLSNSKAITAATTHNYDALSHEVEVLREELDRMKSTPVPTKPFTNPNPHTPSVRRNNAPSNTINKICYNCGESGHHM